MRVSPRLLLLLSSWACGEPAPDRASPASPGDAGGAVTVAEGGEGGWDAGAAGHDGGPAGDDGGPAGDDGGPAGDDGGPAGDDGAVATGCAAPGTLCWDFEQGNTPAGWAPSRDEFAGALVVDGTRPHRGKYSLHAKDLIGGTPGQQGGPKKTIKYALPGDFGPLLWGRAFVYTTPARPDSHAGLFNARYPRPGSIGAAMDQLDWYEVASYTGKYMSIWHPPEPPGYPEWVLLSGTPIVLDTWACLEWLFDAANGAQVEAAEPRVWLDGVELAWPSKYTFSVPAGAPRPVREKATTFSELETGVYLYQGLSQVTNWWIDDLAVGPRRIGCN